MLVRGVDAEFIETEKMLGTQPMKDTVTGKKMSVT
jgi:hypothetical protein